MGQYIGGGSKHLGAGSPFHLVVADPRLEVVDLELEVPERRSGPI